MKKYYRLEYLESFVGKRFIDIANRKIVVITGLAHSRYNKDTFNVQLETNTGLTNVEVLLRECRPYTKIGRLLYVNSNYI